MHTLSKEFQEELSLTRIDYLHFFFFVHVDSNCSNNKKKNIFVSSF